MHRITHALPPAREQRALGDRVCTKISVVGFADDTTTPCRLSQANDVETSVRETFANAGEQIHPKKTERMRAQQWEENIPRGTPHQSD